MAEHVDLNDTQIRDRQWRLAHPIIPWSLKDRDVWPLIRQGFWFAASGWGLHCESMN